MNLHWLLIFVGRTRGHHEAQRLAVKALTALHQICHVFGCWIMHQQFFQSHQRLIQRPDASHLLWSLALPLLQCEFGLPHLIVEIIFEPSLSSRLVQRLIQLSFQFCHVQLQVGFCNRQGVRNMQHHYFYFLKLNFRQQNQGLSQLVRRLRQLMSRTCAYLGSTN
ncbi:hypothetical protein FGO68_gene11298 [Halteria grandinella]|uniref:Uncharacterized protein n=1 Tax=Halteria grandinella TaxID=5974 RepID=A0A8J8N9I2_HALGN|nr:hypothetical protein FGO68_gene11298 [Halteria grandinella]